MNRSDMRSFNAARNAFLDQLAPFLKSVVTKEPVTHCVAGIALVFEWGRADHFAWVPMPVLVDVRKSQALSRGGGHDRVRYWDPWDPEPEQYAAASEISLGTVGVRPTLPEVPPALLEALKEFEAQFVKHGPTLDTAQDASLGVQNQFAVDLAKRLNAVPWLTSLNGGEDFCVYPWSRDGQEVHLVRLALPGALADRLAAKGLL